MTRVAAVLAVAMVLAVGTCLLDGGEQPGHDLCLTFLTLTHGPYLDSPLRPSGTLPAVAVHGAPLVWIDQPFPPPRG